jgi:hypothetical protein
MSEHTADYRPPFLIRRTGEVLHRDAGHVIGSVHLTADGWEAQTLSERLGVFWGRKYAARAIWDAQKARQAIRWCVEHDSPVTGGSLLPGAPPICDRSVDETHGLAVCNVIDRTHTGREGDR